VTKLCLATTTLLSVTVILAGCSTKTTQSARQHMEPRSTVSQQMTQDPLTSVDVTFRTGSDDKRKESRLEMYVLTARDIVASDAGSYGLFDNNSTNGPFSLGLRYKPDIQVMKQTYFKLIWDPWHGPFGNTDEWHFSGTVSLHFASGAMLPCSFYDGRNGLHNDIRFTNDARVLTCEFGTGKVVLSGPDGTNPSTVVAP